MIRLLDRYVFRECIAPFLLGLLVFTFMLLISLMFRLAEMIIQRDVPATIILRLLGMSLPNILVLTIPMALLFGVLIAIGRLSSDSELIAMRASGISLFALYRPVMLFSLLATLVTGWLMLDALPRGNSRVDSIYGEVLQRSVTKQVQPGFFYSGLSNKILFVFGLDDQGWNGVFLSAALPGRENVIQVARRGFVQVLEDGTRMQMDLRDTATHKANLDDGSYHLSIEEETKVVLEDRLLESESNRLEHRNYKSMTIPELQEWKAMPERTDREARAANVQIHQKFAIPAACVVFALFAVPLGFNNRRGGRSSGFALSIPIILIYRILQSNGENAAADGSMEPWLAMWLPNLVFLLAGLFLIARKNRDKALLFTTVDQWIRQNLWSTVRKRTRLRQRRRYRRKETKARRRRKRTAYAVSRHQRTSLEKGTSQSAEFESWSFESGGFVAIDDHPPPRGAGLTLRLPRMRLGFPTLLDRYLLRTFFSVFVIVVLSGITVYILSDLTELFDEILDYDIPLSVVLDYYQVFSFQVFRDLSPLVVLLTILIGFGLLSRSNEIVAAKAAGLSLYRLSIPALFAAALVSGTNVVLETSVLPYSNARAAQLKAQIKGQPLSQRTFRRADRQWLLGEGGYIYHFQNYDPSAQRLQRLHVFHFAPETHELDRRLYAQEAVYKADNQWAVAGAWMRTFDGLEVHLTNAMDGQLLDMQEPPDFFDMEIKDPSLMTRLELQRHIESLEAGGQDAHQLEVQLHNKIAMPAISFVMAFVALPFAFRLGKKGALYGIGLSIALGIFFYAVVAIFTTLGQAGSLPPLVAAWSPHVLFASLSLYLFLGIET